MKAIIRSYTKKFEKESKYIERNLKILENVAEMVSQFDIISIKPGENARKTINVCLLNQHARRIAGDTFWNQLLGTFEIDCKEKTFEVVVEEKELLIFKEFILKYDQDQIQQE